jgi:hypothetical protein
MIKFVNKGSMDTENRTAHFLPKLPMVRESLVFCKIASSQLRAYQLLPYPETYVEEL